MIELEHDDRSCTEIREKGELQEKPTIPNLPVTEIESTVNVNSIRDLCVSVTLLEY